MIQFSNQLPYGYRQSTRGAYATLTLPIGVPSNDPKRVGVVVKDGGLQLRLRLTDSIVARPDGSLRKLSLRHQRKGRGGAECPSSDDLRLVRRFAKRGSGSSGVRLGGLQPVLQATVCNSLTLDTLTLSQDCLGSAEVDVSRREVVDALMVANVIVVLDEGGDLSFEVVG